jgi:hypothetical protein
MASIIRAQTRALTLPPITTLDLGAIAEDEIERTLAYAENEKALASRRAYASTGGNSTLRRPDRQRHPLRLISGLFYRPASLPDDDCRRHQARSSSPVAIAPWRSPG